MWIRSALPSRRLPILLALTGFACGGGGDTDPQRLDDNGATTDGPGLTPTPEAVSLLGEPLYPLPPDPAAAPELEARLDSALTAYEADPDDPDALIWLGRRLAYTGRYRDALAAFSEGIQRFPDDARFYRHRGHRYITLRDFDRAIEDLDRAARLISGSDDVVEPDGLPNDAGVPRSTLHTNTWYHLALARYLQGDFEGAVHGFGQGLEISPNDDMRVAMADWLWMALMRLGREDEAARAIAFVEPEMDILENDAYHRRLLLYRGLLPADSLAPVDEAGAERSLQLATYGYGLGNWYLVREDTARARRTFEEVLDTGYWPAFGFIAAEAELARWD